MNMSKLKFKLINGHVEADKEIITANFNDFMYPFCLIPNDSKFSNVLLLYKSDDDMLFNNPRTLSMLTGS